MEWVEVYHSFTKKLIGAVGFLDNKIAVIVAFYEDKDWNHDGRLSAKERVFSVFALKGKAIAEVASQAYADPDILERDPSLGELRGKFLTQFATGLIVDAVYISYLSLGVSKLAGVAAAGLAESPIAQFVVKKGMEAAVKDFYRRVNNLK